MSRKFLESLAGSDSRLFRRWLEAAPAEPRIAWYPSSGSDFRDIAYLSKAFADANPARQPEPPPPDLFIHTDYMAGIADRFVAEGGLYNGRHAKLKVLRHERLPLLQLPVSACSAAFPDKAIERGRVDFMEVSFQTPDLGTIEAPLLFISAENAAFCDRTLLPLAAHVSHIVQVRYGHGFGGAACGPAWLLNVFSRLRTEVFISDEHHDRCMDWRLERLFAEMPQLGGPCEAGGLQGIRTLPESRWSRHGDVEWLLVPSADTVPPLH